MRTVFIKAAAMLVVASAALLGARYVDAQTFPTKPVRLVIPYPAGGLTDVLGRAIAQEASKI